MNAQIPFGTNDFAENPEPRCACVLLLDISGSMGGQPIDLLNSAVTAFRDSLFADSLAAKRVEIAIITFGGQVETVCDFTTPEGFHPPTLNAGGNTPMGAAINQALDMLQQRKQAYKTNGIAYYRPWVFMITDGGPTDEWASAAERIKQGEASKAFSFFAVGVEGANFDKLKMISVKEPLKLQGLDYRKLFVWLSSSLQSVSRSTPGDTVPLSNPAAPGGWAAV